MYYLVFSYLLYPCEKERMVPELAGSWRSAASTVNSGERRSSSAARSNAAPSTCSDRESPETTMNDVVTL